tara:strand:- start:5263 stop:5379 length:117 start_codon:yes stop_codon:yes gene_type:complete
MYLRQWKLKYVLYNDKGYVLIISRDLNIIRKIIKDLKK